MSEQHPSRGNATDDVLPRFDVPPITTPEEAAIALLDYSGAARELQRLRRDYETALANLRETYAILESIPAAVADGCEEALVKYLGLSQFSLLDALERDGGTRVAIERGGVVLTIHLRDVEV